MGFGVSSKLFLLYNKIMTENHWHSLSREKVVRSFVTDAEHGLSDEEAWHRQKKSGKNQLPAEKPLSKLGIFFDQLKSPLIYILIIAGLITLFFREFADSIVIFGAVILNTAVGFFQENKAGQALNALKKIVKIEAQVIREGEERNIDSADLVQGDIIVFTSGNKVPADARLIEVHHLKINEAPLTGEWLSAQKNNNILPKETSLADRDNMVYMGCTVENGKGRAVVTAIGKETEIGKIAVLVKETKETKTPLQKKIAKFSKIIGAVIAFTAFFIFIEGILKGKEFLEMFMTSIAVAVAAIPEGLPVALTVILALGMQRILKRKGLVRKLAAAEVLGSTSVIASDKTLTLTEGNMRIFETITPGVKIKFDEFKISHHQDQILLLQIAVLNSEAFIENPDEAYPLWVIRGRATDKSLILGGAEVGLKKPILDQIYAKIDEIPFSSENKFVASLVQALPANLVGGQARETRAAFIRDPIIEGAHQAILVSGAPEKIISHSSFLHKDGRTKLLEENDLLELNKELEDLTGRGLRVVAAAFKEITDHKTEIKNLGEEINNLTFVGFVGLKDSLRPEAREAISLCRKAGMKPIIVTGDHLLTAKAVAEEIGLKTNRENIIEGRELDNISDEEFRRKIENIEVYARVEPRHKLRIIEAWQNKGQVVAMTGDGINDTPALKKADIGIALGSGTDVAKEVSDLVLLTDNFSVIVAAVEEGRVIIDNIRKVITYLLSDSFTETILIGASVILGWPLPVSAVQILWVNLIEDGLPNMALAFEPKEEDALTRKPEGKNVKLLTQEMKTIIFVIGFLTDFILLGILWWFLRQSYDIQYIRTIIFACLGIDSLFYVFSCRNLRKNIWRINPFSNKFLIFSVVFGFSALAGGIYLPLFQELLKTVPLRFQEWLIVLGLGLLNILLIELVKYIFIVRRKQEK